MAASASASLPLGPQQQEQLAALDKRRGGEGLSAREIERRVVPMLAAKGWQYLGFDYDPDANIYTLKFLRNGTVVWVDVDARTGQIVRHTGN